MTLAIVTAVVRLIGGSHPRSRQADLCRFYMCFCERSPYLLGSANNFKDLAENLQRHKVSAKYGPGIKWRPTIGPL
jgi:hypothetical protein